MKYIKQNNIHIIEVPITDFKIILSDTKKKSALPRNYCNAGFFATFKENKQIFTLPVAHLVCDYNASSQYTKKYCNERGKFNGNKFTFDSSKWSYQNAFYNKPISTLLIKNNKAEIKDITSIPSGYTYAISGIPIMRNGSDVKFDTYVRSQGWDGSPLYGTWHIFIGLKKDVDIIYVVGMKTTTGNMIKSAEVYRKFKELGVYDVIKLDGGGSFYMNVDGKAVASTTENRLINTIICFDGEEQIDKTDKVIDNAVNKESTNSVVINKVDSNIDKTKDENKVDDNIPTNSDKSKPQNILKTFLTKRYKKSNITFYKK